MKKLNNKGFSLVELIIVIAIMAILVGVVGSQVIPYLENSRKAKDIQVLSSWNTSAMSAYSNSAALIEPNATYTIEFSDGHAANVTVKEDGASGTAGTKAITDTFNELCGFNLDGFDFGTSGDFESKAGQAITKVVISIDKNGKMVMDITCDADGKYHFDSIYGK